MTLDGKIVDAPARTVVWSLDEKHAAQHALMVTGEGAWMTSSSSDPIKILEEDGRHFGWSPDNTGL